MAGAEPEFGVEPSNCGPFVIRYPQFEECSIECPNFHPQSHHADTTALEFFRGVSVGSNKMWA